jgi:hypothetical protein
MALVPARILTREEWEELKREAELEDIVPEGDEMPSFGGLRFRPKNTSFAGQNPNEQIFILLRRHWVTNLGWIMNAVLAIVIPFAIYAVLLFFDFNASELLGVKLISIILALYFSLILTYIVRHLIDWYYNLYIVTDERVVDYDFKSLLSRGASESALSGVETVKESSIGFLPNLFNYGDVKVISESDREIIFHSIPEPVLVRDKVVDLAKVAKGEV